MKALLPRLHVVTADHIVARSDCVARARAVADEGNVALHARARLDGQPYLAFAEALASVGASLFVNDRADIVRAVGAHGLHLPAAGLPTQTARRLVGDVWIGRSTHTPGEARTAAEDADYVFLGPIWETASHPERSAIGLDAIREAQPARVIAIGGITPERVAACREAGAYGVAVLSAVWDTQDPGSVVRQMMIDLDHGSDG